MPARGLGVIDVGSNSVRLVVFWLARGGAILTDYNDRALAGLGKGLQETGRLNPDGVEMAIATLKRFRLILEARKVERIIITATAAVRSAKDGGAFVKRVRKETGFAIETLSGEDEARTAAQGVLAGIPDANGIVADMGGSSLELTRVGEGKILKGVSLPLGALALGMGTNAFDAKKVGKLISANLAGLPGDFFHGVKRLYTVGGTWRSLASVERGQREYPLPILHNYAIRRKSVLDICDVVTTQSPASLVQVPGVSSRRVQALPYGALVLKGLMEASGAKEAVVSAYGLREGLAWNALSVSERKRDPLEAGARFLATSSGASLELPASLEAFLGPVVRALPEITEASKGIDHTRQAEYRLFRIATILTDLAGRKHPDHRGALAFNEALVAPFGAVAHWERVFLACILFARYNGRDPLPDPKLVDFFLTEEQKDRAHLIGAGLRAACALSARAPHVLDAFAASLKDGDLHLSLGKETRTLFTDRVERRFMKFTQAIGCGLVLS